MPDRTTPPWRGVRAIIFPMALVLGALWLLRAFSAPLPRQVPYTELLADVQAGKVKEAAFDPKQITATLSANSGKAEETIVAERIPSVDERSLLDAMEQQHVVVRGVAEAAPWWTLLVWFAAPILLLPVLLFGMSRSPLRSGRNRPMTFGRSRAKLYDRSTEQGVRFDDVAGVDEAKAELAEVVRFLKEPAKYHAIGAHVPKGVLLVGAPGTGKTLLARAVAGESGVPFFSMSGSEFVEMFVGVGASRVRDLFEQAKERAPCIVFIDELDALGKTRSGAAGFAPNEEREQTLNQLLVEMDGFEPGSGLIIMAATNRPEILDRALLRAGRFDRQVLVDRPDLRGREAILHVHARKVLMGADVDLAVVARRTSGMVGSDLANVVNEAALASVRRGGLATQMCDFEEAMDRIQLGLKKEGRIMTDDEKRRVAFHEAGHALVALSVAHADPVHRVTIIPRSVGALGATLQLPTEERYLMTIDELSDRICVLFGGRTAEELACGAPSTGATDDLERATEIARQMVCRFGMSQALGPAVWDQAPSARLLFVPGDRGGRPDCSEETARLIDSEVRRILDCEHARARKLLQARGEALESIAHELLVHETLEQATLAALARDHARPLAPAAPAPMTN